MKRNNFEELLKGKLDRMEVRPPADMWEKLEKQLPEIRRGLSFGGEETPGTDDVLRAPKIRRPLRRKMRWAYVAASVAAVGMMVFSLQNLQQDGPMVAGDNPDTTQTMEPQGKQTAPVTADPADNGIVETPRTVALPVSNAGTAIIAVNTPSSGTGETVTAVTTVTDGTTGTTVTTKDAETGDTPATTDEGGNKAGSGTQSTTTGETSTGRAWNDPMNSSDWQSARRQSSRVSTSLFAMNAAGTNSLSGNVYGRTKLMNSSLVITDVDGYPDDDEFASSVRSSTAEYKLKHDLPLSFGASVNFGILNRVSVETGITYTYMRSKGKSIHGSNATATLTQKLHYLGIPLKVRYDFLQTLVADLYVSGGGSLEKLLSGKRAYRYNNINGAVDDSSQDEKIKAGHLQASLGANLGVEFNIDNTFGLYLEPGVGYFFENKKQPESYRTENPFNFTLKAGFRVNL